MERAKGQAENYARDLPVEEGRPPFLIVCDCCNLYLPDLRRPELRDMLRAVWLDPKSLDPSLRRAEVTRDIAALLARLASALEGTSARPRHAPALVATFLMRCIFCMFAQSVGLLPEPTSFSDLLRRCRGNLPVFLGLVGHLWRAMDRGGFSAAIAANLPRFNGGLFRPGVHGGAEPLPVTEDELALLILAAGKDWADVEPAIFGTLLKNALDRRERAQYVALRAALARTGRASPTDLAGNSAASAQPNSPPCSQPSPPWAGRIDRLEGTSGDRPYKRRHGRRRPTIHVFGTATKT